MKQASTILGLLGVLFIGLKLGGIISWSWWWVTAPFWGDLALLVAFVIVAGGILVLEAVDGMKDRS